jgi:hypothetical protein
MRKILSTLLILLNLSPALATGNDSLLQAFKKSYRAEKTGDKKFIGAIFEATKHTFSINNPLVRHQLIQTGKPDTSAFRMVTANIISRFLDETLMDEECNGDFVANKQLLDFYIDFQCNCITQKTAQNKGNPTLRGVARYLPFVESCIDEFNKDTTQIVKIRTLIPDIGLIDQIRKCVMPYFHVKCPMVRTDLLTTCYHIAMEQYQIDKEEQRKRWQESLTNYLLTKPAGDMSRFYASDAAYTKIKSDFYTPARRLGALNATRDELYSTSEFTNNKRIITFVYSGKKPEVICQLVYDFAWENFQMTIKSTHLISAANIKEKMMYIIEATQRDTPPPMLKLK